MLENGNGSDADDDDDDYEPPIHTKVTIWSGKFLSCLQLAKAYHRHYFSGIGDVNFHLIKLYYVQDM